jgi:hypothetical protein
MGDKGMEVRRWQRLDERFPRTPRGADGFYRCRYCGAVIRDASRHYRAWCSSACSNEAWIRVNPTAAAHHVYRRDQGICRVCGLNVQSLKLCLEDMRGLSRGYAARWDQTPPTESLRCLWRAVLVATLRALELRGFDVRYERWQSWSALWACDHIVEHAEGGPLEPENLQLLCTACHKTKTRDYMRRRSLTRNGQMLLPQALASSMENAP